MFQILLSFIISIRQRLTTFFYNNKQVLISFQNNQMTLSLFSVAVRNLRRRVKNLPKRHHVFLFLQTNRV